MMVLRRAGHPAAALAKVWIATVIPGRRISILVGLVLAGLPGVASPDVD